MISQETNFKRREKPEAVAKPLPKAKRIFGSNLLYLRNKEGISMAGMGAKFGVERTRYEMWERGECAPNYDYLVMIAQTLNLSIDTLLTTYLVENE